VTRPNQSLSSLAPGGGRMRDPGNEVAKATVLNAIARPDLVKVSMQNVDSQTQYEFTNLGSFPSIALRIATAHNLWRL